MASRATISHRYWRPRGFDAAGGARLARPRQLAWSDREAFVGDTDRVRFATDDVQPRSDLENRRGGQGTAS